MDSLTFISSLLTSWPLALVLIVFILRGPIGGVIRSLERLSVQAGGVSVDLSSGLQQARQQLDEAEDKVPEQLDEAEDKVPQPSPTPSERAARAREQMDASLEDLLRQLVEENLRQQVERSYRGSQIRWMAVSGIAPQGAVKEAWRLVDEEVRELAVRADSKALKTPARFWRQVPTSNIVSELVEEEVIPSELASTIQELEDLHKEVTPPPPRKGERGELTQVDSTQASEYVDLALRTVAYLRRLPKSDK